MILLFSDKNTNLDYVCPEKCKNMIKTLQIYGSLKQTFYQKANSMIIFVF